MSSMGDFVVTSGADRALRVWQRTEEPFFVEEEKEKRLESLFEADLEVRRNPKPAQINHKEYETTVALQMYVTRAASTALHCTWVAYLSLPNGV
jgi:U3 small nucleolar RNA-associated protein 12